MKDELSSELLTGVFTHTFLSFIIAAFILSLMLPVVAAKL